MMLKPFGFMKPQTAAASAPTFTRMASGNNPSALSDSQSGPLFSSIDLSSIPVGDEVMVALAWSDLGVGTVSTPTLGGVSLTPIPGASTNDGRGGSVPRVDLYRTTRPAGSGILDLQMGTVTGATVRGWTYFIYHVQNRTADVDVDIVENALGNASVNTTAGGAVFALTIVKDTDDNSDPIVFTGATKDGAEERSITRNVSAVAKAENVAGGTLAVTAPRPTNGSENTLVVLSVE